jgi:hypothetical protein
VAKKGHTEQILRALLHFQAIWSVGSDFKTYPVAGLMPGARLDSSEPEQPAGEEPG